MRNTRMLSTRGTVTLVGGLLAAGALALSGPAAANPPCQGGPAQPVKNVLHAVEGPVSGTPAGPVVHAVECALP